MGPVQRFAFPLLIVVVLFSGGCFFGGGDGAGDSEEFALIDFGDDPTPIPVDEKIVTIGVSGDSVSELSYLYETQLVLEDLDQLNRDLQSLVESGREPETSLEWVVSVHELSTYADQIFDLSFSREVPVRLRERYEDQYLGELEVLQVMSFGRDRLMASAIVLGPGGRGVSLLGDVERREFYRNLRESMYFFRDSQAMIAGHIENVGAHLSGVRLRP